MYPIAAGYIKSEAWRDIGHGNIEFLGRINARC
jgi:hypothetical protein